MLSASFRMVRCIDIIYESNVTAIEEELARSSIIEVETSSEDR